MEILKDLKQIENKIKTMFGFEIEVDYKKFISENLTYMELNFLAENVKTEKVKTEDIDDFSDLIFQLKNYIIPLSNFVKLLLKIFIHFICTKIVFMKFLNHFYSFVKF